MNVQEVRSNPHFTIHVHKKSGRAAVSNRSEVNLYKGNETPQPEFNPSTGEGELKRLQRVNPSPILFKHHSAQVTGDAKLDFFATYLKRINNPEFDMLVKGYTNTVGGKTKVGKDRNQALSEQRAKAVVEALRTRGVTNHTLNWQGVGQTGATDADEWRKVEIIPSLPAGWQNLQDVQTHEFGHQIGLR